jgi:HemY protein
MIRLVWLFLVVVAIAVAAALLSGQSGEVSIRLGSTTIAMHPAVAAGLAIGAVALLMAAWRLLGIIFDWPLAMSRYRRDRRRRATYLALAKGMVAVAAGDSKEARHHQKRAKAGGGEPLLGQLLGAQIAQLDGDEDGAARTYADMLGRPETEFLGLRGLFVQALRRGDIETARRYAGRAYRLRPQTPWVTAALFDLGARAGQWQAAATLVDAQVKRKQLTFDVARRRKAVLAAAEARDLLAAGKGDAALDKAQEALKTAPGLLPAALTAAAALRGKGKAKKAAAVLERAWADTPHPDVALAYATVSPLPAERRFDRLIALKPADPESRLLSAAQVALDGRLNEAEGLLAPLLSPNALSRASRLMADIALARSDEVTAGLWAERAAQAPAMGRWTCSACKGEAGGWAPVCPHCGAFDTLAWSDPGATAELAPQPGDAAFGLYRLTMLPPPADAAACPPDIEPGDDEAGER